MRAILTSFLLLVCLNLSSQNKLYPIAENGKWGLVDNNANFICKPVFDYIEYISKAKKFIYYLNNKKGLIGENGVIITDPIYNDIILHDTVWASSLEGDNWNLFSPNKIILNHEYHQISKIENDLFLGEIYTGSKVIKANSGSQIVGSIVNSDVKNGYLICQFIDSTYSIYNKETLELIDNNIVSISELVNGYLKVYKNETVQLFDPVSIVYKGRKMVQINELNEGVYDCIDDLRFVYFIDENKYYKVPKEINVVSIKFPYVIFENNNKQGVVDLKKGKVIISPKFDDINYAGNNFLVRSVNQYGYYSAQGKIIIPCKYQKFDIYDSFITVQSEKGLGVYSIAGKLIEPLEYSDIKVYENSIKCYKKKSLTVVKINEEGEVIDKRIYQNYMSVSIGREIAPRQRFRDLSFGIDDIRNQNDQLIQQGNWFKPLKTRIVKDSVIEYYGRWGLKDDIDSIVIKPMFSYIKLFPKLELSKAYRKKPFNSRLLPNGCREGDYFMSSESILLGFPFPFILVDEEKQKIISRQKLHYLEESDFTTNQLARGYSNGLVLISKNGEVAFDSLTYYGDYSEDILRICENGHKEISSKIKRNYVCRTYEYLRKIGAIYTRALSRNNYVSVIDGDWYFINSQGNQLNNDPFQFVFDFIGGKAIVKQNNKWGVVDTLMNVIVPIKYDNVVRNTINGEYFFTVTTGVNQNYMYNKNMGKLMNTNIGVLGNYSNGVWTYQTKGEKRWGIIDTSLNIKREGEFDRIYPFNNNNAVVLKRGKRSLIATNGDELLPYYRAKSITELGNNRFAIKQKRGVLIIEKNGDTLLSNKKCKTIIEWDDNYVVYKNMSNVITVFSFKDDVHIPNKSTIISFSLYNKILLLKRKGKYRLYGLTTNEFISKKIVNIESLGEESMIYKGKNGLFGYMSFQGDTLTQAIYKKLSPIKSGWAHAIKGKVKMIINKYGVPLFDFPIYRISPIGEDYIISTKTGKGVISADGSIKIRPIYGRIELYNTIFYRARNKDEKCDLFDLQGERIISKSYKNIKAIGGNSLVVTYKQSDYLYTNYLDKSLSFQNVYPFSSSLFLLKETKHLGVYNNKGELIIPIRYHKVEIVKESFQISFFNSFGFYHPTGQVLFDPYTL